MPHYAAPCRTMPHHAVRCAAAAFGRRLLSAERRSAADYSNVFNAILGGGASQADAFRCCGLPLVEAALNGQATCLFAYGQTGSGKTFSMYGAEGGKNPSKLDGVVPAICAELFRRKQEFEKRKEFQFELGATLVEVQGNNCIDLLADADWEGKQPNLKVCHPVPHSARWLHCCARSARHAAHGVHCEVGRAAAELRGNWTPCMRSAGGRVRGRLVVQKEL
jgi:hypothetical protein